MLIHRFSLAARYLVFRWTVKCFWSRFRPIIQWFRVFSRTFPKWEQKTTNKYIRSSWKIVWTLFSQLSNSSMKSRFIWLVVRSSNMKIWMISYSRTICTRSTSRLLKWRSERKCRSILTFMVFLITVLKNKWIWIAKRIFRSCIIVS